MIGRSGPHPGRSSKYVTRQAARVAVVVSCAFLCTACNVVRTMEPLWAPANPQIAAQIAGEWREPAEDGELLAMTTLGDSGGLALRWTEPNGDWGASIGRVIALDDERILEINLATLRESDDDAETSRLQGFTYFRIALADGRLHLHSLSEEGLAAVVTKAGVALAKSAGCDDAGTRPGSDEPCYLTIEGDPQRIVELFRRHGGEIFSSGDDDDAGLVRANDG